MKAKHLVIRCEVFFLLYRRFMTINELYWQERKNMEPITIGDKEYTVEEISELVEYGNKYQQFEKDFDTDPEKAWRAYGKITNENKDLKTKLEQMSSLEKELEDIKAQKAPNNQGDYTQAQVNEAKQVLKSMGVVTKDDLSEALQDFGFVKKDDVENAISDKFSSRDISKKFDDMESTYNGKDGRPKFDSEDILSYMERNRIGDPEKAYKMKFTEELSEWRANKILAEKYPNIVTGENDSRSKKPERPEVTRENMKKMLKEKLGRI